MEIEIMEDALHICKFQYKAVILAVTTGMYMSFQKPINVETLTKTKVNFHLTL